MSPTGPNKFQRGITPEKKYIKGYKSEKISVLCEYKFIPRIGCQYLARRRKNYVKTNPYMKFQVNMSKDDKEKSGKRNFSKAITHVKVGQTRPKSNLTCIMSRQIQMWNFNSICQKMTKKIPENEILAKGNNSCKSRSNATKVDLDLYDVKTNSYMKFQLNMSKDDKEMSGKRNFYKRQ